MFKTMSYFVYFHSRVFENKESMLSGALETATLIAEKSPIAVQGSKVNMVYSRDHSVPESLEYMASFQSSITLVLMILIVEIKG